MGPCTKGGDMGWKEFLSDLGFKEGLIAGTLLATVALL